MFLNIFGGKLRHFFLLVSGLWPVIPAMPGKNMPGKIAFGGEGITAETADKLCHMLVNSINMH